MYASVLACITTFDERTCALVAHCVLLVWFNCVLAFVHSYVLCRHVLVVCPSPRWLRRRSPLSYQPLEPRISLKISFLRNTFVFLSLVMYLYVFVLALRAVWSQSCVQCGSCSVLQARKQDATCTLQAKHVGAIRGHCGSIMSQWCCQLFHPRPRVDLV